MKSLITNISANWGLLRIMRMGLAVFILYDGYKSESILMLLLGGLLAWQALANVGCASCDTSGSCSTDKPSTSHPADELEVDYEEVTPK